MIIFAFSFWLVNRSCIAIPPVSSTFPPALVPRLSSNPFPGRRDIWVRARGGHGGKTCIPGADDRLQIARSDRSSGTYSHSSQRDWRRWISHSLSMRERARRTSALAQPPASCGSRTRRRGRGQPAPPSTSRDVHNIPGRPRNCTARRVDTSQAGSFAVLLSFLTYRQAHLDPVRTIGSPPKTSCSTVTCRISPLNLNRYWDSPSSPRVVMPVRG